MPIKGRQYWMYNFAALMDENPWVAPDIADVVNRNLQARTERFEKLMKDGAYWDLTSEEKHQVSPEIMKVEWFPLDQAVLLMQTCTNEPIVFVNSWQEQEFRLHGVLKRDPMYQTMVTLQKVQEFDQAGKLNTLEDDAEES
jgi:hypothetical protein